MTPSNTVASIESGADTFLVLRDPVSTHLYSIARRGSTRVLPKELQETFKSSHEAVTAIRQYLSWLRQSNGIGINSQS